MRRRTSSQKRKFSRKLLRSSLSLLRAAFRTIFIIVRRAVEYVLVDVIFWFVIPVGLGSLFIAFGMPQNIALNLAIAIPLGLLILAVCIWYKFDREKKLTRNKREGEIRLASSISRIFANRTSTEWEEYQDWLHDILLARCQLLDAECPRWKVKLITYGRLSIFCIIVAIAKVKQAALRIRRSR